MKKTIQFFIKSAIIFVLCSQLVLSSSALTVTPITPIDPCESYAMQMVRMVDGDDEQCPWDNTTAVSSVIPLYDCNNNVNGYIYNLSTNLKDTGFVQIFYKDGVCSLVGFAYEGRHYIEAMLGAYGQKILAAYDATTMRIVYAGGMTYLLKNSNNAYYDLNRQDSVSAEELTMIQSDYSQVAGRILTEEARIQAENATMATTETGVKRYVAGANNLDIVVVSDFEGQSINGHLVGGHCAPTAATTIVKYWANRRNVPNLYYYSDWWVFSSLYVNMNTCNINNLPNGPVNGTGAYSIMPGLINYSEQIRGVPTSGHDFIGDTTNETVTFDLIKTYITWEIPIIALQPGHAVCGFGYYTVDGRQQLIIANGWTRAWTFQNFSSLGIGQCFYVRWN